MLAVVHTRCFQNSTNIFHYFLRFGLNVALGSQFDSHLTGNEQHARVAVTLTLTA